MQTLAPPRRTSSTPSHLVAFRKRQHFKRAWLEAAVLPIVGVLALEVVFRMCGIGGQEYLQPDKLLGCSHIPGKQVIWRLEGFSNDYLSSIGLRDIEHSLAKQPGVTRIALLGDSSTEGMQVGMNSTYARVLEHFLNNRGDNSKWEVINFACASYGNSQQMLQYEARVRQYKPDIVVLLYNRGDMVENVYTPGPGALSQPRPYFYLDEKGQLLQDNRIMELCADKLQSNPTLDFLRRNSRIFGVLNQMNLTLSLYEKQYRKITSWFSKASGAPAALPPVVSNEPPLETTKAILSRLAKDVQKDGSRFILLVFPNNTGDLELMMQSIAFKTQAEKDKFTCFDLTEAFQKRASEGRCFLEYHFSALGHRVVAEELFKILSPSNKLPN